MGLLTRHDASRNSFRFMLRKQRSEYWHVSQAYFRLAKRSINLKSAPTNSQSPEVKHSACIWLNACQRNNLKADRNCFVMALMRGDFIDETSRLSTIWSSISISRKLSSFRFSFQSSRNCEGVAVVVVADRCHVRSDFSFNAHQIEKEVICK